MTTARTRPLLVLLLAVPLVALLAGCGAGTGADPAPTAATPDASGPCADVTVIVDFGVLEEPSVAACVAAGPASEVLAAAGVEVEGTVDYGDQVVCRVAGRPGPDEQVEVPGAEPFVEECQSMPSANAYWALWVRDSSEAEWAYATEGVATLELGPGQSLGLVYTAGTDETPPKG